MFRNFIILLFVILFVACKNQTEPKTTTTVTPPPPSEAQKISNLPMLPQAEIEALYYNCDFVDYTFYDPKLPMSISLNEISSIRSTLGHIAQEGPQTGDPNCKPLGRIFYQSKGEYILEAEFHLADGCSHLIFFKDGKAAYANSITEAGRTFYSNNINHGVNAARGGQQ